MAKRNINIPIRSEANPSLRQRLAFDHPHLYFTAPALAWAIFVLWGSLAPPSELPHFEFNLADKLEHALSYAVLGALILRAWLGVRRPVGFRAVLGTVGFAYCWGMLLEVLQSMTDYRTFDWMDGLSNIAGGFAGALIWYYVARVMRNRSRRLLAPMTSLPPEAGTVYGDQGDKTQEGHAIDKQLWHHE